MVEVLRAGAPTPQSLAVLATYRPLGRLASAKTILRRKWPAMLDGLITQQIREPLTEAELLTRIPKLTAIDGDISLAVQRQYEENPYPRWIKAKPVAAPIVLERDLRRNFPHAPLEAQSFSDQPVILIAGCGTGQQVVDHAKLFPRATILAMDLSLTSLSYAARKAEEHKIRNVEFVQADIMKIVDLKRQFDLVISDGVLHHLSDPAEGWRQLVSVLRPGGFMRISL